VGVVMDEENLNLEIRKFLKKIGIKSQQIIDQEIKNALNEGKLSIGSEINLEMTLSINSDLDIIHTMDGVISIK